MIMSELLLQSVKQSYYHEVLSYRDAESRLEGREGAYLLWESDVKQGLFVISYVKSSSVKRILVPNKDARYLRQSLEQAVDITADLIAASECHHPIPPPSQISSRGTERETSAGDNNRSRCYCCSFINETKRALDSHQKLRSFGLFNVAGAIQQRQKGRKMMSCLREGCNFQTRQAPSRPQLQGCRAWIERLQWPWDRCGQEQD